MIHPTCASPRSAAERPSVLDLSQGNATTPSLATGLGSATVLDLSNPNVLNTLASNIVFTPNTEQMLLTTLSEAVCTQEIATVSPTPITVISSTQNTTQPQPSTVPLMVAEAESGPEPIQSPAPSMASDSASEYSTSMDSMDPMVARAVHESSTSGTLTPLIKTELKCTIQKKRILAGKNELSPEELLARKDSKEEVMFFISFFFDNPSFS